MITSHRHHCWTAWILVGLTIFALGLAPRLYPLKHRVSSDAYEKGTVLVIARIRGMLEAKVKAQFPGIPDDKLAALTNAKLNEVLSQNREKVREVLQDAGDQIQQGADDDTLYLLASDSYYFLELSERILNTGAVSEKIRGNRYFNDKMLAPVGFWEPHTWHPYIGAWITRALRLFRPGIPTMETVAWTPIVLLPLAVIAFLFACWALGASPLSSLAGGTFFILATILLKRSTFAWYDNDIYNVIFPTLTIGLLCLATQAGQTRKRATIFGTLTAASIALYARFWTGWSSLWVLTIISTAALGSVRFLFRKSAQTPETSTARTPEDPKNTLPVLLLSTGVTFLLIVLMNGLPAFFDMITAAWGELQKFINPQLKGWPDLFIVVGELKKGTLPEMIALSGGWLVSLGALGMLLWETKNTLAQKRAPQQGVIILATFLGATAILGLSAQRFAILYLTPAALLFTLFLERLRTASEHIPLPQLLRRGIVLIVIASLCALPTRKANTEIRTLLNPIFNSVWERTLLKIRQETPTNSIVNAWWPPGHFIKAIAQRRVTFDGASIKGEQGYWITRVYLAQSEREALGILRMLNTSSNKAAEWLQAQGFPLSVAVPLLRKITQMPRSEAAVALKKALAHLDTRALLDLTHGTTPQPPPSYVLIHNEIVDGNVLLGYVGKWDFAKIEALNKDPKALKAVPPRSSKKHVDFLWGLVGGPYRQSDPLTALGQNGDTLAFSDGLMIDTARMTARIDSGHFGKGVPQSLVYFNEATGRIEEKQLPGASLGYSVVLFSEEGRAKAVLMDRELANSLIVKLYYFKGQGLRSFKLFSDERDLTGRTRIVTFEVQWPEDF